MKYNIFKLYVVSKGGHNFICIYDELIETFTEVLTKTKIKKSETTSIDKLENYYSLLELGIYKEDKLVSPLKLTKKAILYKYIELNQKQNNRDFDIDSFLEHQESEIKKFKELRETNPQLAKVVALQELKESGILDDNGELRPPYDKVFVKSK